MIDLFPKSPLPKVANWPSWDYKEYLWFFLSQKGTRRRLKGSDAPLGELDTQDKLWEFCRPIRERIQRKFDTDTPHASIALVAYNEERQLIPTLLSYTLLECSPGMAELIVVDNNSTDRTKEIIQACGARYVHCEKQGTPFARKAGLEAAHDDAEYLWMSDGDTRVVPPASSREDLFCQGTVFRTQYEFMEANPGMVGVSSGAVVEDAHWIYRLIHKTAVMLNQTAKYSCWSGVNQFVRRDALEASGGIDTSVLFGEDHHRHYQLARWARKHDKYLNSANMDEEALGDPVYYSGRRYATLGRVSRHYWKTLTRSYVSTGRHWTETEHEENLSWEDVR